MPKCYGSFGPLIGVIYVNNTHCRFLVYSAKNAEVLTFHELKLKQIVHNAGWMEYDPTEIWKHTLECIEVAYKNLVILEISPYDIIAVGICSVRGTTVIWDSTTGASLYNAIGWTDCRCTSQLKTILNNVKYNVNYLRPRSGLPLSTCFGALKIEWLMDNVTSVPNHITKRTLCCDTLDSWLLWSSMVMPAAIIAPKPAGEVVCGLSSMKPTISAMNCIKLLFSAYSPPKSKRSLIFFQSQVTASRLKACNLLAARPHSAFNILDEQEEDIIELSPKNVFNTSTTLSLELISGFIRNSSFNHLTVAPALLIAPSKA
uniref:Carbohydrate kinase FGGY N-terminal domain-containing protein n=1 Tax=Glossina pallidipes TaxID=7398 RepID=A0A1A9Z0L8_GLOPL